MVDIKILIKLIPFIMKKLNLWGLLGLFVLFLSFYSCSDVSEETTTNEDNVQNADTWDLSGNIVSHDPCLVKEPNSLWWAFMTGEGIGVKYSSDGLYWTQGTQVFSEELDWWRDYVPNMGDNDVWAPDCFYYDGTYYLYYCVSEFGTNTSAIGLASCSSILTGDWEDQGVVVKTSASSNSTNALDPNAFLDEDGNPWLVYGSWFDGIKVVQLKTSTMKPTGTTYAVARKSGGIENPDIRYYDGYYYLFVSIGVCCNGTSSTYKIAYGRSTSVTGPYYDEDGDAMLDGGCTVMDSGNDRWVGPGAQDIYKHNSDYLLIRHAYDADDDGNPKMLISDINFDDGWPSY